MKNLVIIMWLAVVALGAVCSGFIYLCKQDTKVLSAEHLEHYLWCDEEALDLTAVITTSDTIWVLTQSSESGVEFSEIYHSYNLASKEFNALVDEDK